MSRWIENDAQWYEQRMVHCACCGRLIAKHFLVVEHDGVQTIFCSEGCEELHRDYVLPTRGRAYRPSTDVGERYEELIVR